ncbi:RND family transporter [Caproiciproducens galactitolivorans]|uniref:efflux RND transporter permease subunit n=1 Tax=Caproiciproducens galactitolivorans TaxID=642589 RepID=UPI00240A474C|nr:efflux RND transporter permease subunit [Caproiciproducens galactitolivorans]
MKLQDSKKQSHSIVDFIINKRKHIERFFIVLVIISAFLNSFVGINYDLTKYLPDTTPSQKGISVMKKEFGYPGTARVMIDNVTLYQAKAYKDRIEAVDGVDMVVWADTKKDIYQSGQFIDNKDIDEYYKNGYSVMDITFDEGDTSKKTSKAIDKIKAITGDKGHFIGAAVQNKSLSENLNIEVKKATVICVILILITLLLTTTSWFEPILFLLIMGIAIIINMGTNIFLGEISFLTSSVGPVLQLAVAMDYSIFLIHSFTAERQKGMSLEDAIAVAIRHSAKSILACGVATFFGFIALALMKFSIGFDMGVVLAKGIFCSVATVLFLMPSLIIRWAGLIEKTAHRPFLPPFDKFAKGVFKGRFVFVAIALLVAYPAYVGKGMTDFVYGSQAVGAGMGTKVYEDEQLINKQFGRSNMLLLIVPNTSRVTEKKLVNELDNLKYTKSITSLADKLPDGLPESIIPESITSELHTKNYARILMYIKTKDESKLGFQCSDQIQSIVKKYYPKDSYVVGTTPFTQDIKTTITSDYDFVDALSLLSVAIVVMITFKSLLLPVIILIPIEIAIFINMLFPYLTGNRLIFMGYVIVSCIQLGATVDYAILMTNNFLESRQRLGRKEATIDAIATTTPPLLTSATILTMVGYILYFTSSISAIGDIGHLIGRGTMCGFTLVITVLPALLYIFDKPIKKHMERMDRLREKKEAKQKVLRQNFNSKIPFLNAHNGQSV